MKVKNMNYTFDIDNEMRTFADIIESMKQQRKRLIDELSDIDHEIADIAHAAEFYELNAAQGYMIYKALHETTIRRREVKDNLMIVESVLDSKVCNVSQIKLDHKVDKLNKRSYHPRVLKDIFRMCENCEDGSSQ